MERSTLKAREVEALTFVYQDPPAPSGLRAEPAPAGRRARTRLLAVSGALVACAVLLALLVTRP